MLDARFSYESLLQSQQRAQLVTQLQEELTRRLRVAAEPARESWHIVEELRVLGHDLWSFDESNDFQLWCGDWVTPKQPYELILAFDYRDASHATATIEFKERIRRPQRG